MIETGKNRERRRRSSGVCIKFPVAVLIIYRRRLEIKKEREVEEGLGESERVFNKILRPKPEGERE